MNTPQPPPRTRILIVEDELLVRMFAVDTLEDAGFEVVQAGDGGEALTIVGDESAEFAAIVVDLGLPDRSGDQVAAEIRAMNDKVPILIASGRSERELKEKYAHDGRTAILVKPYTSTLLLDALESLGVPAPVQ